MFLRLGDHWLAVLILRQFRDTPLSLVKDASASLDERLARFVLSNGLLQADLARFDLLDQVFKLIDGLLESEFFIG